MSYYHDSQARIDEAEAALREGDVTRARSLYRDAARLQRTFIDSVSRDRVRTKSIYGLSAATLFHRAGDLDEAERLAHQLLAEPWIEAYSARGLRALLHDIWAERHEPNVSTSKQDPSLLPPPTVPPEHQRRVRTLPRMSSGRWLGREMWNHA
jgi:hypothetical protein